MNLLKGTTEPVLSHCWITLHSQKIITVTPISSSEIFHRSGSRLQIRQTSSANLGMGMYARGPHDDLQEHEYPGTVANVYSL